MKWIWCKIKANNTNPIPHVETKGWIFFKYYLLKGLFRSLRDLREPRFWLLEQWVLLERDCITSDISQWLIHNHDNCPAVLLIQQILEKTSGQARQRVAGQDCLCQRFGGFYCYFKICSILLKNGKWHFLPLKMCKPNSKFAVREEMTQPLVCVPLQKPWNYAKILLLICIEHTLM